MKGCRILIIDDEKDLLTSLRLMLRECEVFTASTAEEAVEKMQRNAVDVIVSDVKMPGVSCEELLKTLRKLSPGVPVILISGQDEMETMCNSVEYGAVSYLEKPFLAVDLRREINSAVRGRNPSSAA